MKTSFLPLRQDAIELLSLAVRYDYRGVEFSNDAAWFCCTVRNDRDHVMAVAVFEFKNPYDAHLTAAILDRRALSRKLLTTLFTTVFKRAKRVTALIDPENEESLRLIWRLGFRQEGYLRRGYDGRRDAVLLGLLPEDCPYMVGTSFVFVRDTYTYPPQASVH